MRVVFDTNILISRFLSPTGVRAVLVYQWLKEKKVTLIVSEAILEEYQKALMYPSVQKRHQLSASEIERFIILVRHRSIVVSGKDAEEKEIRDPKDSKFLTCAREGNAKYLISGDRDLLVLKTYHGIQILTPGAFLTLLKNAKQVA